MDQATVETDRERELLRNRLAQLTADGDKQGVAAIQEELDKLAELPSAKNLHETE